MMFPFSLLACCLGFLPSVFGGLVWEKTTPLPYPISDMSAVTVGEKIYLMGGCIADQPYIKELGFTICPKITNKGLAFVPATKKFEVLPPAPTPRYRHAAVALGGKIYIAGGRSVDDKLIKNIDVFDTVSGTWGTAIPWSGARSDNAAIADGNNLVLVGGYNYNYTVSDATKRVQVVKVEDGKPPVWLQTDCWLQDVSKRDAACNAKGYGDLQVSRGDVAAVAGADGQAYLVGGKDPVDFCPGLETVEVFDTETKKWSIHPSKKKVGRSDNALAFHNGHIVVVGGERFCGSKLEILNDVEMFNVTAAKGEWKVAKPSLPARTFRMPAAQSGGNVYVFGGQFPANAEKANVISGNVFVYTEAEVSSVSSHLAVIRNTCLFLTSILLVIVQV